MNDRDDRHSDRESILMALDQISQTIDVMTSVVGRLRSYVEAQGEATTGNDSSTATGSDRPPAGSSPERILH
ncbi:MAG: hypothetical protein ACX93N_00060 [Pseudohaliea sp.]